MFLGQKTEPKRNTQLSADVITHKLKIKGEGVKYINKKLAENIFAQMADSSNKTIAIANPNTLTFITKYRSEIGLIPLGGENSDFEDILFKCGLSESQKEEVREIWKMRKKEKKSRTNGVLKNIIDYVKNK